MRQSASITYKWGMLKLLRLVIGGYKTGYRSLYIYTIKIIVIIIFIGLVHLHILVRRQTFSWCRGIPGVIASSTR